MPPLARRPQIQIPPALLRVLRSDLRVSVDNESLTCMKVKFTVTLEPGLVALVAPETTYDVEYRVLAEHNAPIAGMIPGGLSSHGGSSTITKDCPRPADHPPVAGEAWSRWITVEVDPQDKIPERNASPRLLAHSAAEGAVQRELA